MWDQNIREEMNMNEQASQTATREGQLDLEQYSTEVVFVLGSVVTFVVMLLFVVLCLHLCSSRRQARARPSDVGQPGKLPRHPYHVLGQGTIGANFQHPLVCETAPGLTSKIMYKSPV